MRTSLVVRQAVLLAAALALAACGNSSSSGSALMLVSTSPASGATNVPVESDVSATFGAVLASASVTTSTFYLTPAIDGSIQITGAVATFKHATPLAPSTMYTATLSATISDGSNHTLGSDQSWSFTTAALPDTTPPAQVTTLAAGTPTTTTVPLTWTAVGNDGELGTATSYKLRYATGSGCPLTAGNFSSGTLITTSAPQASGSAESATATGLTANTAYCFGLIVGDAAGNLSPLSNIVDATTAAVVDTTPPAAITDLMATATSQTAIQLTWTATGDDGNTGTAASYDLREASGASCPITDATFTASTPITLPPPLADGASESFTATGLTASTEYCFAIKATDAAGNTSAISNIADTTTQAAPIGVVGDLAVASVVNETINLSWTSPAHADSSATYDIYGATGTCPPDSSGFIASAPLHVGSIAVDTTGSGETYAFAGLQPSTVYCFGLTITDGSQTSALSNFASGTTGDNVPPGQVTSITVGTPTSSTVPLSWTAPGDNDFTGTVASYNLRSQAQSSGATDCSAFNFAAGHPFPIPGTLAAGGLTQSVTVTGLSSSTAYCFAFTATDAAGNVSAISTAAFAITAMAALTDPPGAVTDLAGTSVGGNDTAIDLTWTAPGLHDETGTPASYDLRYSAVSGTATDCSSFDYTTALHDTSLNIIFVSAGNTQTAEVDGLTPVTNYCFALTASDAVTGGDVSVVSNAVLVSTLDDIAPATMVLAVTTASITDHAATLTSVAPNPHDLNPNAAAASYDLRYIAAPDCTGGLDFTDQGISILSVLTQVPQAPGAAETFVATGLPANATLCFAIASTDAQHNESPWSQAVEVDTLADTTAPDATVIAVTLDGSNNATVSFNLTADDGSDPTTGPPANALALIAPNGNCPITAGNLDNATLASTTVESGHAALAPVSVVVAPISGDVLCYAIVLQDAALNNSAVSNSITKVINGPVAPTGAAATNLTTTGFTFGWIAGSGDGTGIGIASSYSAAFTQAASCTGFTLAGSTPITGLPTPLASGNAQSIPITGLTSGTSYCFGIAGNDAYGNTSAVDTVLVTTPVDPSAQIAAIRAAIEAPTTPPTIAAPVTFSLPITGAVVSFIKLATGAAPDGDGFFIQNLNVGPALYFAIEPTTFLGPDMPLSVGDVLDITATAGAWLDCSSCSKTNSIYVVTAATGTRTDTGHTIPSALVTDSPGGVSLLIPASTPDWQYESMLVTGQVTMIGAFLGAGTGYLEAAATTETDLAPAANVNTLAFRLPTTLVTSSGITNGCVVQVNDTPLWRDGSSTINKTEISGWVPGDFTIQSCPAPNLTSSLPTTSTSAQLTPTPTFTFDSPMNPNTIVGTGAGTCTGTVQLTTAAAPTVCIAIPALTPNATDTTFTSASALSLTANTAYVLTLTSGITTNDGVPLAPVTIDFTTAASQEDCTHMVISQIYGADGNTYKNDYVELFNPTSSVADLTGCSVQYASATGSSWQVSAITAVSGGVLTVQPGAYFLIEETGTTAGASIPAPDSIPATQINLSGGSGKVALVNGTSALSGTITGGTGTGIVDFVGYGTAGTFRGTAAAPAEVAATSALVRGNCGYTDANNNSTDFTDQVVSSTGTYFPHNSSSPAVTPQSACTLP